MTAFLAQAAPVEQVGSETIIQLNYYLIEISSGSNATVVPVAGIAGNLWAPNTFGTILVGDNPLIEGPSPSSPKVGQVRGLGTFNRPSRQPSVLSIVGGTGKFEGARGSAFLQTYNSSVLLFSFKFALFK
ncbi:hypothetical protein M0R45_032919 [Rubus argutus]